MAHHGLLAAALLLVACGVDPAPKDQPILVADAGEVDAGSTVDAGPPPDRVVLGDFLARLTERFDCGGMSCGRYRISFDVENQGLHDVESLTSLQLTIADTTIRPEGAACVDAPWLLAPGETASVELQLDYLSSDSVRVRWPCGGEQQADVTVAGLPDAPDHGFFSVRVTGRFVEGAPWGAEVTGHIADVTQ